MSMIQVMQMLLLVGHEIFKSFCYGYLNRAAKPVQTNYRGFRLCDKLLVNDGAGDAPFILANITGEYGFG